MSCGHPSVSSLYNNSSAPGRTYNCVHFFDADRNQTKRGNEQTAHHDVNDHVPAGML